MRLIFACIIIVSRKPLSLHPRHSSEGEATACKEGGGGSVASGHVQVIGAARSTGGALHPFDGSFEFLDAISHGQQAPTTSRRPGPRCWRAPSARPRLLPLL